jgi:hypothetical protein
MPPSQSLVLALAALVALIRAEKETVSCGVNTYYWGDYQGLHYCVDCPKKKPYSQGCGECKIDSDAQQCSDRPPRETSQSHLVDSAQLVAQMWHTPLSRPKTKAPSWWGLAEHALADPFISETARPAAPAVYQEFVKRPLLEGEEEGEEEVVISDLPPELQG